MELVGWLVSTPDTCEYKQIGQKWKRRKFKQKYFAQTNPDANHIIFMKKKSARSAYDTPAPGTRLFPRFRESSGTLNLICPSVRPSACLSVCPSVRPSVTKTLTLAITFALLQVDLWYLACVFFVTRPFRWYHVLTLTVTFDLLQGQICCRAGDHNSPNLLVYVFI